MAVPGNRRNVERYIRTNLRKIGKHLTEDEICDLVDDYFEKQDIIDSGATVEDLPTLYDIKWFFQDPPKELYVKNEEGESEEVFEIDVDNICLNDELATKVFKNLYSWYWEKDKELPNEILELIKLNNIATRSRNKKNNLSANSRLANICLVGIVRFYHIEKYPYIYPSKIIRAYDFFKSCLNFINKVHKGKISKDKIDNIDNKLYIFNPFEEKEN